MYNLIRRFMVHFCIYLGEKLTDEQVDEIIRLTDLQEDLEGNVKYEGKNVTVFYTNRKTCSRS